MATLVFVLHPTSRLFVFHFPILCIWQLCQTESNEEEKVDLNEGGEKTLVVRRQLEVDFEKLSEGEFALQSAFKNTKTFEESCILALKAEPAFNVQTYLQKHILLGTIVNFY